MTFVNHRVRLHNTPTAQPAHKFLRCDKCEAMRPPEGGVDLNPNKWFCASCWARRATKRVKEAK